MSGTGHDNIYYVVHICGLGLSGVNCLCQDLLLVTTMVQSMQYYSIIDSIYYTDSADTQQGPLLVSAGPYNVR